MSYLLVLIKLLIIAIDVNYLYCVITLFVIHFPSCY